MFWIEAKPEQMRLLSRSTTVRNQLETGVLVYENTGRIRLRLYKYILFAFL